MRYNTCLFVLCLLKPLFLFSDVFTSGPDACLSYDMSQEIQVIESDILNVAKLESKCEEELARKNRMNWMEILKGFSNYFFNDNRPRKTVGVMTRMCNIL